MNWLELLKISFWVMGALLRQLTAPLGCLMFMALASLPIPYGTLQYCHGRTQGYRRVGVAALSLLLVGILVVLHDSRLARTMHCWLCVHLCPALRRFYPDSTLRLHYALS